MTRTAFQLARICAVIVLVCAAAALATPKGRMPLALRGIRKMLRKDAGGRDTAKPEGESVPPWRKLLAFVLVLLAAVLAVCP